MTPHEFREGSACLQCCWLALLILLSMLGVHIGCESVRTATPTQTAHPPALASAVPTSSPSSSSAVPSAIPTAAGSVPPATTEELPRRIYIHPLGPSLPDADVDFVRSSLAAFYAMDILLLPRTPLPSDAYYAPRSRYRAEKLLDHLLAALPSDGFRALGLTGHDISTTKDEYEDWGILGLATVDGEACVISSFRARRGSRNAEHARIRLGKTAVHEIGHTLGLPHCPNQGCLMEDARGTVVTTDTEYDLCHDCRARLEQSGYSLAQGVPIPWPRPE